MQIEELLKCLSLPKRYYGETFVIREKLKEENKKFQRDLKACISDKKAASWVNAVNKTIKYAARKSQRVFCLLDAAIKRYEDADLKAAQEAFDELMDTIKSDLFYSTLFGASVFSTKKGTMRTYIREAKADRFFRIRAVGSQNKGIEDNAEELFHIPITKRQLISNERFSLSGFPTLYLATELPLAWQECGYPDKYYWSEFRYSNLKEIAGDNNTKSGKICLLALYSPREITRWGRTIKYYEPELWLTVIRRYLAIYPLVLACSFVNANGGTPFKQEYIIPQMLMQWVYRHKRKCNGISYFSCIDDSAMPSKWNAYNVALPAMKPYDKSGYSCELQEWFSWSKPQYHVVPTSNLAASAEDRKILNAFVDQELPTIGRPFIPQVWKELYWRMIKVAMQMRSILEFSNDTNLKMILAAFDAIGEEYNSILYELPKLSEVGDIPECQDEITRIHVEHEIYVAQKELMGAAEWFKNSAFHSTGIGWIIEKYRDLTWNGLHGGSSICVASPNRENAIPILWRLREKHILYSYQQLKDDDSTIQWLQNIADIEKCSIAMFWNTAGATQKVDLDWAKQNIKSIKAPILARSNYISIFSPDNIKEIEFLGFGEDIERIIEKL